MKRSVLITGGSGGVGSALKEIFYESGYYVVSIDRDFSENHCHKMINFDISDLHFEDRSESLFEQLGRINQEFPIKGLINNAALQIVRPLLETSQKDLLESFHVNVLAPFVLSKRLQPVLSINSGAIVNVGSIHAQLTKANFAPYSITKTALRGLSKAMALEWGDTVPVNNVEPAAIDTEMLRAGFKNDIKKFKLLEDCHPTKSIASTAEVAKLIYFLIDNRIEFLNGANIQIDGAISKKLHDPG